MEKIVFEGTREQIENLKLLLEHGDNDLPRLREEYQTENLWSIEDVQLNYECDEDEAMQVLKEALQNDATMEQIWFAIHHHAENLDLKRIEE